MTATAKPPGPEDQSSPDPDTTAGARHRVNPPDPDGPILTALLGADDPASGLGQPIKASEASTGEHPGLQMAATAGADEQQPQPSELEGESGSPALATLRQAVRTFDRWAEQPFSRLRGNKAADRLFYGASEAANFSILWHAMAWTPVLLRPSPHRVLRAVSASGSLAVESVLVNGPVKSAFRRTRPVLEQGHLHVHHLRTPRSTSFPSGHASAAMVAVMVMGRDRHWTLRWLLAATAMMVGASRVHVRIHHPSDVVGGAGIGWLLGRVLRRVLP